MRSSVRTEIGNKLLYDLATKKQRIRGFEIIRSERGKERAREAATCVLFCRSPVLTRAILTGLFYLVLFCRVPFCRVPNFPCGQNETCVNLYSKLFLDYY